MGEGPRDPVMGIGDDAVRAATGHDWRHWFAALDAFDVAARGHAAAARHLAEAHGLGAWWAQGVTVRYELDRGLRAPGQRADGRFAFSVQRTIDAPADRAFAAWASGPGLDGWFTSGAAVDLRVGGRYATADGDGGRYLDVVPGRRLRFTWENPKHAPGSVVDVAFEAKGPARTTVRVSHERLATRAEVDALRPAWRWALDSLAAYLETGTGHNRRAG